MGCQTFHATPPFALFGFYLQAWDWRDFTVDYKQKASRAYRVMSHSQIIINNSVENPLITRFCLLESDSNAISI